MHVSAVHGMMAAEGDADAEDVSLAAAGDARAFERLYRRNVRYVARLAYRMVGADEADDATQDVFVRLWEKARSYRGESAFRTWLFRLAMNVLLRRAAVVRTAERRHSDLDDSALRASSDPTDARLDVDAALRGLPPDFRAAVVLHDLEGYSHGEMAAILGISVSAARMRLHRARRALRDRSQRSPRHDE